MQKLSNRRHLTPAPHASRSQPLAAKQWWVLAFSLLLAIPVVLGFWFQNQLYDWYLWEFVEPELEREFGFRGELVAGYFTIVEVTEGGVLDQAGVEPGDRPAGYHHGFRSGFLSDLIASRGSEVQLGLVKDGDISARTLQWKTIRLGPHPRT